MKRATRSSIRFEVNRMSISKEQLTAMMGDKGRFNWSSGNLVPVQEPDGAAGADTENKGNEQSEQ